MQTADELKALYRRYIEQVWQQRRLDTLPEFFTADHLDHDASPPRQLDAAALHGVMGSMQTAFPDARVAIEELFVDGDTLIVRLTFSGTQQGEFFGIPPTGKRVEVGQIHILRFREGKMAEHWSKSDDLLMLRQLGVVPEAPAPHAGQPEARADTA